MNTADTELFSRAYLIRAVEERLLELFTAGKVKGTTHTCIGQEFSALALADSLDRARDVIFSNHRCHGHYIAWTDDVEGLIAEVMGRGSGVCGGYGGSQHLCGRGFFSNGVQGGILPVAAGLAFARRLDRTGGIAVACIGDGTLGEGVVYETLNIASRWQLPLLVVLENNLYAQSTSQAETLAGGIADRARAFGVPAHHGSTWSPLELRAVMSRAAAAVRSGRGPAFVQVDTYRLAAHSKGDDNRDPAEIEDYRGQDPLNQFMGLDRPDGAWRPRMDSIRARIDRAVEEADAAGPATLPMRTAELPVTATVSPVTPEAGTQLEALNEALRSALESDPGLVLLGEDVRSPYGGAFKVTRGLSDQFPDRVLNTPISEAAIVGVGNGLALGSHRAIVEIMFGDFLTLCFDQLVNHAAKFPAMYNGQVRLPLVVRTPMGGGRGYGPTHSQNLEKHVAGVPGLRLLVLHGRSRIRHLYRTLLEEAGPVVVIENKLLYGIRPDEPLPPGYAMLEGAGSYPATVLRPPGAADLTIVAFGRMSVAAEEVARDLQAREEIAIELIFPLQVSPPDLGTVTDSVARTRRLLVVEEGAAGHDLASEVLATIASGWRGREALRLRRIGARPVAVPNAHSLEQEVLPSVADIRAACLELFDA